MDTETLLEDNMQLLLYGHLFWLKTCFSIYVCNMHIIRNLQIFSVSIHQYHLIVVFTQVSGI